MLSEKRPIIFYISDASYPISHGDFFNESFELIPLEINTSLNIIKNGIGILLECDVLLEKHCENILEQHPLMPKVPLCIIASENPNADLIQSLSLHLQTVSFIHNQIEINSEYEWKKITAFFLSVTKSSCYNDFKRQSRDDSNVLETLRMIAHQWRQPINLISMEAINLMVLANLDTAIKSKTVLKSADLISQQTQRMSDILKSILNMGKEGRLKHLFTINTICDSIFYFFKDQFKNQNVELSLHKTHGETQIYGFQTDLEEVLINLIANARDAYIQRNLSNKRVITLSVDVTSDKYIFSIQDEAGGVPNEIQEKIFEANFSTKLKGEGFGIGLHVARLIIEKEFGGTLSLKSNHRGSEFIVTLPRSDLSNLKFIH